MHVRDLRLILKDLVGALSSSDATKAAAAVRSLDEAMDGRDAETIDAFLADVEQRAQQQTASSAEELITALKSAGQDEKMFLLAFSALSSAKLKKSELQTVVTAYTGRIDKKSSAAALLDVVKLHFYERLYDDATHKMAVRATPF